MAGTNIQTPDLQSILATLANFAPPVQQSQSSTLSVRSDGTSDEPAKPMPRLQSKIEDPRLRPQERPTASPKPMIDPSTITTWQDGLRCVTKIAAQNASFAASIKKMMENQRQNEMRWYAERQALKQSQGSRERASAQANEILKGLSSGSSVELTKGPNSADLENDLVTFDRKIYAAKVQMDEAMTAQLKALGVPFFGTEPDVVVGDDDSQVLVQASSSRPKHSPLVTEKQLLELRRRMVEHLEALYRD